AAGPRKAGHEVSLEWVRDPHENDGDGTGLLLQDLDHASTRCQDDVRLQTHKVRDVGPHAVEVVTRPPLFDMQIDSFHPAQSAQLLSQNTDARLYICILCGVVHKHAETPNPRGLLPPRRQRPRRRRGAEEREEGAAVHRCADHSITSSVSASSLAGTS